MTVYQEQCTAVYAKYDFCNVDDTVYLSLLYPTYCLLDYLSMLYFL